MTPRRTGSMVGGKRLSFMSKHDSKGGMTQQDRTRKAAGCHNLLDILYSCHRHHFVNESV